MAAFPMRNGTGTVATPNRFQSGATLPLPDQSAEEVENVEPQTQSPTLSRIDQREKGDKRKLDFSSVEERMGAGADLDAGADRRKELAGGLAQAISRVVANHGRVKMAAALQILKHELSRGHDVLGTLGSEGDYLSIIVLLEQELGNRNWKEISKQELACLKTVVEIGVKEPRVTYDHYNQVFRRLNASGWRTGPVIEFDEKEFQLPREREDEEPPG
jgi:hypothetical protein